MILEAERESKKETLVKELLVGQVREGIVKNITDFGAFIDLGGLDGLLHITDMSWGRVGHPSEVVDIAATIDVKVLDIDWTRERLAHFKCPKRIEFSDALPRFETGKLYRRVLRERYRAASSN